MGRGFVKIFFVPSAQSATLLAERCDCTKKNVRECKQKREKKENGKEFLLTCKQHVRAIALTPKVI